MSISMILDEKKANTVKLKKTFGFGIKSGPLGLIKLSDNNLTLGLIEGLKFLPAGFVVYSKDIKVDTLYDNIVITGDIDDHIISGFDFVVCDDSIENLNLYINRGIIPIISKNNHMTSILKEFNPLKNEGNSFFYEDSDKWSIFYSIARYLENYKFPFDNKNLVRNILKV